MPWFITRFSNINLYEYPESNSLSLITENICHNSSDDSYYVYKLNRGDSYVKINGDRGAFSAFLSYVVLRWGWNIRWRNETSPLNEKWITKAGTFISQPFLTNHIFHFAESVGQILLKLQNRTTFPEVQN
jgi:hypothetical protein